MSSLKSLYTFGSKLLDIESLESVYKTFVSEAAKLVGAQYGSIFLLDSSGLQRVYASNRKLYSVFPRPDGLTSKALKGILPLVCDVKDSQEKIKSMNIKSVILIPLIYKQKPIGILTLLSKKKEIFSHKELRMLQLCGVVASSAIIKAQLAQQLQSAVESRDLFIAMASHELKTPLTAITVYSQMLRKKTERGIMPKRVVTFLSDEISRFNQLVGELLQLNTIQKGKLTYSFASLSLHAVLADAAKTFRICFPHHRLLIQTKHTDPCMIWGDREKLIQAFTNLLNNAGKFSPEKSPIVISLLKHDTKAEISIADQGPGISRNDIPHIFSKFYKGASNQPGLGLGLFLVKVIISEHNGTISVATKPKKGTTFTIRLPLPQYERKSE